MDAMRSRWEFEMNGRPAETWARNCLDVHAGSVISAAPLPLAMAGGGWDDLEFAAEPTS